MHAAAPTLRQRLGLLNAAATNETMKRDYGRLPIRKAIEVLGLVN
jgi:hypothetical protein